MSVSNCNNLLVCRMDFSKQLKTDDHNCNQSEFGGTGGDKKKPSECLKLGPHPSVPDNCRSLGYAFFECKRSLLDMRTRFRGRKGY